MVRICRTRAKRQYLEDNEQLTNTWRSIWDRIYLSNGSEDTPTHANPMRRARRAWRAGEDLSDVEGLRQEALDLARARHGELVLLAQLVHAQNGDDVLQVLVVLRAARQSSSATQSLFSRCPILPLLWVLRASGMRWCSLLEWTACFIPYTLSLGHTERPARERACRTRCTPRATS